MISQQTDMTPATDAEEANPYRSPLASGESNIETASIAPPARRRFRWRVIPTAVLYLFGGWLLIYGLIGFGALPWLALSKESSFGTYGVIAILLVACPCLIAAGGVFLFAGRSIWLGRWRRGIVASLLAFGAAGCVPVIVDSAATIIRYFILK
jgi:hypothetical protein